MRSDGNDKNLLALWRQHPCQGQPYSFGPLWCQFTCLISVDRWHRVPLNRCEVVLLLSLMSSLGWLERLWGQVVVNYTVCNLGYIFAINMTMMTAVSSKWVLLLLLPWQHQSHAVGHIRCLILSIIISSRVLVVVGFHLNYLSSCLLIDDSFANSYLVDTYVT